MLQFPPAASLDLRWEGFAERFTEAQKASQAMRHFLPKRSSPAAASESPQDCADSAAPRNQHLPFSPLSLLGLSSRRGAFTLSQTPPPSEASGPPTQDSVGPCAPGVLQICRTGRGEGRVPPRPDRPPKGLS